jgi:hypothetical protein
MTPITIYEVVQVTGFTYTVPNDAEQIALKPAGTLASGTITMPAAPTDGQVLVISSTQTVTALTHSANTGQTLIGAATTILANTSAGRWVFFGPTRTWYPR